MHFISYKQLAEDVKSFAVQLGEIGFVIGIPRSGLIPAAMLALFKNAKLGTIYDNTAIFISGGDRDTKTKTRRLLFLDDSVDSGTTMNKIAETVSTLKTIGYEVERACMYVSEEGKSFVNHYFKVLEGQRVFEWNLFHHKILENSCVDIDGVICREIQGDEIDDEGDKFKYRRFIRTAERIIRPRYTIHSLVSARTEEWRTDTSIWLVNNGIGFENLILPTERYHSDEEKAKFKADYYEKSGTELFIESSDDIARMINEFTGRPVIATDTMKLYDSPKRTT